MADPIQMSTHLSELSGKAKQNQSDTLEYMANAIQGMAYVRAVWMLNIQFNAGKSNQVMLIIAENHRLSYKGRLPFKPRMLRNAGKNFSHCLGSAWERKRVGLVRFEFELRQGIAAACGNSILHCCEIRMLRV